MDGTSMWSTGSIKQQSSSHQRAQHGQFGTKEVVPLTSEQTPQVRSQDAAHGVGGCEATQGLDALRAGPGELTHSCLSAKETCHADARDLGHV